MSDSVSKFYEDMAWYRHLCSLYGETPEKGPRFGDIDPYCKHARDLESRHKKRGKV